MSQISMDPKEAMDRIAKRQMDRAVKNFRAEENMIFAEKIFTALVIAVVFIALALSDRTEWWVANTIALFCSFYTGACMEHKLFERNE